MALIGLDVGTTGCKAVVFEPDGTIRGYGFQEYGILCDEPGMAEQDAEQVWQITCSVLQTALAESQAQDVQAVSLSVQGDAIIPVDRNFTPVYHAILGMDYRSAPQAQRCDELFGARTLFDLTGMRSHPINSAVKMLWLKEQRPDSYERAWKITTYADFMLGKLGAAPVIDYTMASRTMAFDLAQRQWSAQILEQLDLDPALLSEARPSGAIVGEVSPQAAAASGLPTGTPLVTGGHDQTCAALGAGVVSAGSGVVSTGTAEVLSTAFPEPALSDAMYDSFYPCYCYTKPDMYFTFALNHVGGILLQWYRDNFAGIEQQEAVEQGRDVYEHILGKMPDGPSPLMIVPHFNGSGTPWCDMDAKGAIVGLTLNSTRHDLVRAILECQTYELKINMQRLEQAGVTIEALTAVGGGAKSEQWLQIKADILGRPVQTLVVREAACLGAAILAGTAAGVYASVEDGVAQTVRPRTTFRPDPERSGRYAEKFGVYQQVYPALSPINKRL
jgi:xylulokinase